MHTDDHKNIKEHEIDDADYWRKMYDELETQMYNMMEMTLELVEKESGRKGNGLHIRNFSPATSKELEKELRRLQLFEHRIKVTFLGKITLKYIELKKKLRRIIKGK
jgi:hypothetical protein